MWLRDFLAKERDLNARIMAFNHNTSWRSDALDKSLHDHGDDLIQALRVAREDEVRHDSLRLSANDRRLSRLGKESTHHLHRSQLRRLDH